MGWICRRRPYNAFTHFLICRAHLSRCRRNLPLSPIEFILPSSLMADESPLRRHPESELWPLTSLTSVFICDRLKLLPTQTFPLFVYTLLERRDFGPTHLLPKNENCEAFPILPTTQRSIGRKTSLAHQSSHKT